MPQSTRPGQEQQFWRAKRKVDVLPLRMSSIALEETQNWQLENNDNLSVDLSALIFIGFMYISANWSGISFLRFKYFDPNH